MFQTNENCTTYKCMGLIKMQVKFYFEWNGALALAKHLFVCR